MDIEQQVANEIKQFQGLYQSVIEFFVNYSFQIIGALLITLLGWFVAKKVALYVERVCNKYKLDVTVTKYIANIVKVAIIAATAIIALGKLGISITPFVAAIGAASLGVGLAMQGMLSNYGAGISIILTRPFVVGNTITVKGVSGIVEDIQLGYTLLATEDGEVITIPNKHIIGEVLVNSFAYKVVESVVGIDYGANPQTAVAVIEEVLARFDNAEVSKDSKAQVGIKAFGDFAIVIEYRYWAATKYYFQIQYKINMEIFQALRAKGIKIPYPTYNIQK
jgi:small conductance mechanosensitive channel